MSLVGTGDEHVHGCRVGIDKVHASEQQTLEANWIATFTGQSQYRPTIKWLFWATASQCGRNASNLLTEPKSETREKALKKKTRELSSVGGVYGNAMQRLPGLSSGKVLDSI